VSRFVHVWLERLRRREEGWLIVEIMIGSLVLVITALGIYSGLDGASKASGRNRNRTVAAYLAQQDQERMRTMDAAALSGYTASRVVTVAGVKYTVSSSATQVSDTSGSISCTNKSSTASYLRIRSSVADPSGKNAPVVQDSLLSPKPGDGNAAVQVVDRTGTTGVQNVPVQLQESPNTTTNTDSGGCSLFTFLDNATQYHVGFSLTGYVDVNGVNSVSGPITLVPGTVSITQFQYDKAGTITATYPGVCTGLTVGDSHMTLNPAIRTFDSTTTPPGTCSGATNMATSLFPFTDKYSVYAGSCQSNDPTQQSPAQTATFAPIVTPGNNSNVTVQEPPISLLVQRKTGTNTTIRATSANVKITETDCANSFTGASTSLNGNTTGNNFSQGYPYGKYSVCVDDGTHKNTGNVINNTTSTGASATITIDDTSSSKLGTC
jgi:hypothetical protein